MESFKISEISEISKVFKTFINGSEIQNDILNKNLLQIPFYFSSSRKQKYNYISEVFEWCYNNDQRFQALITVKGHKCKLLHINSLVDLIYQNESENLNVEICPIRPNDLTSVTVIDDENISWNDLPSDLLNYLKNEIWLFKGTSEGKLRYQIPKRWGKFGRAATIEISPRFVSLSNSHKLEDLICFEKHPKVYFI